MAIGDGQYADAQNLLASIQARQREVTPQDIGTMLGVEYPSAFFGRGRQDEYAARIENAMRLRSAPVLLNEQTLRLQLLNTELEQRGAMLQQTRLETKALMESLKNRHELMAAFKDRPLLQALIGSEGVGNAARLGMEIERNKADMKQLEDERKQFDELMASWKSSQANAFADKADDFSEGILSKFSAFSEREFGTALPGPLRDAFKRRILGAYERGLSESDIERGITELLPGWIEEARANMARGIYGPALPPGVDPILGITATQGFVESAMRAQAATSRSDLSPLAGTPGWFSRTGL